MRADEAWSFWANSRGWTYHPVWGQLRFVFRGGGLSVGAPRHITKGWSGHFGNLPCLGFEAGPGDPARLGVLQVVALRVPYATFPELTITPADFTLGGPGMPIEPEFDLSWTVASRSPQFARDVLGPPFREYLATLVQDFHQLWFERDAMLLSCTHRIAPDQVDGYLISLRHLLDRIPTAVFDRLRGQTRQLPQAYRPRVQQLPQVGADEWRTWAERRGWIYTARAKDLVERFHHAPLPAGSDSQFTSGFVGKFGDLPCFGWKWVSNKAARTRHVVALRRPGVDLKPVRLTLEDPLLAELVGSGDVEVGVPGFDERWRVSATDPEFARRLLGGSLWQRFEAPDLPPFGQLWFERDVVAVISEGAIRPGEVDGCLLFLHGILDDVAEALDA